MHLLIFMIINIKFKIHIFYKPKGLFGYRLFCWKLKNNKKNNNEVTVHAFGTVYKPKITVHGQWTVPNTHLGKKNTENATCKTQYPNAT